MIKNKLLFPYAIGRRMASLIIAASTLFAMLTIAVQMYFLYHDTLSSASAQVDAYNVTNLPSISQSLWDIDLDQLNTHLTSLYELPHVRNVRLFGNDGTSIELVDQIQVDRGIDYPLVHDGKRIGWLNVQLEMAQIYNELWNQFVVILLSNGVKTFLMVFIILAIVQRLITRHLALLSSVTDSIDLAGHKKTKVPEELIQRKDEIGHVTSSICNLQTRVREELVQRKLVERQLRSHQRRLSDLVDERTEALHWQLKLNQLLADMSLKFLTYDESEAKKAVEEGLCVLGELLQADRVNVILFEQETAHYHYFWQKPNLDPEPVAPASFNWSELALLQERLLVSESVVYSDITDLLKEQGESEYQFLSQLGICSVALFPISHHRKVQGFVSAANFQDPLQWNKEKSVALTRFSSAISELRLREQHALAVEELQSALMETNKRYQKLAETDELTGLMNRRVYQTKLEFALAGSLRGDKMISVMMIDVDHFKAYNDIYGHLQGDIALKQVAAALEVALPNKHHVVARVGGEEFAALLPDVNEKDMQQIANSLCQRVRDLRIEHKGNVSRGYLTVSVGAVLVEGKSHLNPNDILEVADQRLYLAKDRGRDQAVLDG